MDALALLCTLHADGPATLKRLRQAQCVSLDDVIALDVERLAASMRASASIAERFRREARHLLERVGPEVSAPIETEPERTPTPETRRRHAIERVLSAWRERDHLQDQGRQPEAEPERVDAVAEERAAIEVGGDGAIAVGAVDGLDGETCEALARAGVRDLDTLAACDALALARRSGVAYTRILRVRALAKRALDARPDARIRAAVKRAPTALKVSISERPVVPLEPLVRFEDDYVLQPSPPDGGAGGPFA